MVKKCESWRCFQHQCTKFVFGQGCAPDPAGEFTTIPAPSCFKETTFKRRGGELKGVVEGREKERKERGMEEKGGEEKDSKNTRPSIMRAPPVGGCRRPVNYGKIMQNVRVRFQDQLRTQPPIDFWCRTVARAGFNTLSHFVGCSFVDPNSQSCRERPTSFFGI